MAMEGRGCVLCARSLLRGRRLRRHDILEDERQPQIAEYIHNALVEVHIYFTLS